MKFFKRVLRVFLLVLLLFAILTSLLIFTPMVFGLRAYLITSKSMSPYFNPGDLIYVKKIDPALLESDEIITFYLAETGKVVTHRILQIDKDLKTITTIGDQNKTADGAISFDQVIGKYAGYKLPFFKLFV